MGETLALKRIEKGPQILKKTKGETAALRMMKRGHHRPQEHGEHAPAFKRNKVRELQNPDGHMG